MIILNIPGLIILAISFAIAFGIGQLIGTTKQGPLMIIAGPLVVASDLAYRLKRPDGDWLHPNCGGSLFFLPVWPFGILWLVLGVIYTMNG